MEPPTQPGNKLQPLDWNDEPASQSQLSSLTNIRVTISPEQASLDFFMQHYAAYSLFDYLPALYNLGTPAFLPEMKEAVLVPAMALLANHINDAALLRLAYTRYARVVHDTQHALPTVERAKSDTTLIAVLSLALFEAMALQGKQGREMTGWSAHISGSAALLELRGRRQFDSWLGRKLFLHASHSISASCVIKEVRAPAALLEVDGRITEDDDDPKFFLAARRGRLLRALAEYRERKPGMGTRERLERCRAMVADIEDQFQQMTVVDPFKPLGAGRLPEGSRIYETGADEYSSVRWAQAWNILRMLRIFMSDAVCMWLDEFFANPPIIAAGAPTIPIEHLKHLREDMALGLQASITGVLRSVPFFLDISGEPRFTARSLIGPLYAVASCRLVSHNAKAYAVDRLHHIGRCYGFEQAVEAAESVNAGTNFGSWQVDSSFGRVFGLC